MAPRCSAAGTEFRVFSRVWTLFAVVSAGRDREGFEEDRLGSTFLAGRPAAMVRPPRPTALRRQACHVLRP